MWWRWPMALQHAALTAIMSCLEQSQQLCSASRDIGSISISVRNTHWFQSCEDCHCIFGALYSLVNLVELRNVSGDCRVWRALASICLKLSQWKQGAFQLLTCLQVWAFHHRWTHPISSHRSQTMDYPGALVLDAPT